MIKRLLFITVLGVTLSGCFMAPMALIGPATSGFTTASIVQSGISTGASFIVKRSTGKTISEHVMSAIEKDVLEQAYVPNNNVKKSYKNIPVMDLGTKVNTGCKKYDFYCKRKNPDHFKTSLNKSNNVYKINVGCKKYDFYCKRISKNISAPYLKQIQFKR